MIVSHKYKYICLNPPKTGSGFRETCLYNYCDISVRLIDSKLSHKHRHLNYESVCKFFQQNGWDIQDYYTFTFVRNPWKRYASWYNMMIYQKRNTKTFADYINTWDNQDSYFLKENKRVVDLVGDCDNQKETLESIFSKLDCKIPMNFFNDAVIPKQKTCTKYNYKDFYAKDPALIDIVAKKEKAAIERFGYTFS